MRLTLYCCPLCSWRALRWPSPRPCLTARRASRSEPNVCVYSDAVTNFHDFLVWNARSQEPVEPAPRLLRRSIRGAAHGVRACARALQSVRHAGRQSIAARVALPARGLQRLRHRGLRRDWSCGHGVAGGGTRDEKCWWPAHDARNRRWVAALEPMLAAHEDALSERLSVTLRQRTASAVARGRRELRGSFVGATA